MTSEANKIVVAQCDCEDGRIMKSRMKLKERYYTLEEIIELYGQENLGLAFTGLIDEKGSVGRNTVLELTKEEEIRIKDEETRAESSERDKTQTLRKYPCFYCPSKPSQTFFTTPQKLTEHLNSSAHVEDKSAMLKCPAPGCGVVLNLSLGGFSTHNINSKKEAAEVMDLFIELQQSPKEERTGGTK